jgi:hypothetical protein
VCDGSFARAISRITPELIARLGAKWHGAHNKAAAANVMRNAVIALDLNGLAASYDDLAAADKKMEIEVVTRMLRSGQHAARQHRERTAALVRELFAQTPADNEALRDVKLNVFGVEDGKPIMDPKKHPVFPALHRVYAGDSLYPHDLVLFETEAEHESVLDQGGLPEQKEFMNLLGNFHCFHCAFTLNDMLPVGPANLFHFKHDQAQYSIHPDHYGKKPLIFPKDDLTTSCYLNDFFFYVFSKFSEWQNMKSMTVSSLACVSALTRSTWASHEASGVGKWRIALPEVPCVSKMLIAYLTSFLGVPVSPFRDTQSPMVDARLDLLYREAMDKLDEVDDEA